MKRKLLSLVLALFLLCSMALPAAAAQLDDANTLYTLGLFKGTGIKADGSPIFALDRSLTRQEAIVMLVRLLGKKQEALSGTWETPFTDVDDWAAQYVGYAYANGLTNGTGKTTFGGNDAVTATQYLTFVLRALGYSSKTDFAWARAWEKSDALGITAGEYSAANNTKFLRGDAAHISKQALSAFLKDGSGTLLDSLIASGAVKQEDAEQSGILPDTYTLLARKILAADAESSTQQTNKKGVVSVDTLPDIQRFKEYDCYNAYGTTVEEAMAAALKNYLPNCLDGDYSDGYWGTITFDFGARMDMLDVFILTDTKGMVIAYGVSTEPDSHEYTLYICDVDTRSEIDAAVRKTNNVLAKLQNVTCKAEIVGDQFVYQFSNLPENAAQFVIVDNYSAPEIVAKTHSCETDKHLWNVMTYGYYSGLQPVQSTYTCENCYSLDVSGEYRALFVFYDKDENLIAYSQTIIPVTR